MHILVLGSRKIFDNILRLTFTSFLLELDLVLVLICCIRQFFFEFRLLGRLKLHLIKFLFKLVRFGYLTLHRLASLLENSLVQVSVDKVVEKLLLLSLEMVRFLMIVVSVWLSLLGLLVRILFF